MHRAVRQVRRVLISFAGGFLLPVGLFWSLAFITSLSGSITIGWPVRLVFYFIFWPQYIWERVFPRVQPCSSCGPSDAALIATGITIFVFWFGVTYLLQLLIERFWAKRKRSFVETHA
jgi:hypothetical protein